MDPAEHLSVLQQADARFADAAARAVVAHGWQARVPGCPDWTLADLVWHLAEVQHFWAWVVRTRAKDPSGYEEPGRVADDELLGLLAAESAALETVLAGTEPETRVWTWAPQQDVAFVLRRQALEAVVHAVDAQQVIDQVDPIPADVGLDGLDEWLDVLVPAALPGGPPPEAHPVVLHAIDAGVERVLFAGTRPVPSARLIGNAGDLMLAAWRRLPVEVLTVEGDAARVAEMLGLIRLG